MPTALRSEGIRLDGPARSVYGDSGVPHGAIETALIAGLDHSENQWKNILALPVPRWTIYIGKLLVACGW